MYSLTYGAIVDSVKMYRRLRKMGITRKAALDEAWFNFTEWFSP